MKTKTVECYQFLNSLSLEECCHMIQHLRGCFGYYENRAAENREHGRVDCFHKADRMLSKAHDLLMGIEEKE